MPYRIIIFNQPDKGINIADLVLEPSRAEQRNIKEEEILNYLYNRHYYNGIMQYLPDDCIDILHEFHIWN